MHHFVNFHTGMVSRAPVFIGFSRVWIFKIFCELVKLVVLGALCFFTGVSCAFQVACTKAFGDFKVLGRPMSHLHRIILPKGFWREGWIAH